MMPSVANAGRKDRDPNGLWRTPPEATLALVFALRNMLGQVIHEPCCGDGAMARVLNAEGFDVIATDIADHGYGEAGIDFLTAPIRSSHVVTNPPFPQAAAFIERCYVDRQHFFALLLKATYWSADERFDLYQRCPPNLTLPLTWRLDFTGEGRPTMECAWFVWGQELPPPAAPALLRKPKQPWGIFA